MNKKTIPYMALIGLFLCLVPLQGQDAAKAARQEAINFSAKLPILHEGRIKPLDTYAQVNLLAVYGKRSIKKTSATEWLLEVMFSPKTANERLVFDIRNAKVSDALGLETRKAHKFSFNEVWPSLSKNMDFLRGAFNKEKSDRDLVESQMLELYGSASRFIEISKAMTFLQPAFTLTNEDAAVAFGSSGGQQESFYYFNSRRDVFAQFLSEMQKKDPENLNADDLEIIRLAQGLDKMRSEFNASDFMVIPPENGNTDSVWRSPWSLLDGSPISERNQQLLAMWDEIYRAYSSEEKLDLAKTQAVFDAHITDEQGLKPSLLTMEVWNNKTNLFYKSVAFYIFSFLMLIISWAIWQNPLKKISFYSLIIGFFLHGAGIFMRMIIMNRPPVSTLYESIIFVGFISVLCCVIYEMMRKNTLGIFTGVTLGSILHFMGFSYAADGDTMGMLVAVLDSNFWLATHVVTISIGYGCAFVAGFVGHLYLFFKIFKPQQKERLQALSRNMIGTSLIALFFTLFGTILGGIWADQSWGRFWGWDPKENGALLIVLWFLVLLHGRTAGIIKENGFAFGLFINNIIVALAWFGVNLLNVGLHSYGFTDSIAMNLLMFCGAELLIGGIGYFWANSKNKAMAK